MRPWKLCIKRWLQFLLVAAVVFAAVVGTAAAMVPPDVPSTLPASVAGLAVCWPVAYWVVYRRRGERPV